MNDHDVQQRLGSITPREMTDWLEANGWVPIEEVRPGIDLWSTWYREEEFNVRAPRSHTNAISPNTAAQLVGTIALLEGCRPEEIIADIKHEERPADPGGYRGNDLMVSEIEQALDHPRRALRLYYENSGNAGNGR